VAAAQVDHDNVLVFLGLDPRDRPSAAAVGSVRQAAHIQPASAPAAKVALRWDR